MKKTWIIIGGILLFIVILISTLFGRYNLLVTKNESVKTAWSQVDVQLQRRFDLIPNLVETVKGFAKQERDVFIQVTEARSKVGQASAIPDKIAANNQLTGALSRLLLVVERYPELKSNQNFIQLQDELAGTENRIAVARRRYNEDVKEYNQSIRQVPNNIIASMFNFQPAAYYEIPPEAKATPKVSF